MQEFNEFLIFIDQYLGSSSWFVPLLLGTGVFFTFYLRFPQIRYFSFALKVVRGKFDKKDDQGDTSHFQALTTALSGTVGTGCILELRPENTGGWLKKGDIVKLEVEKLGILENIIK